MTHSSTNAAPLKHRILAEAKHGGNKEEVKAKTFTQEGGIMKKVTPSKATLAEQGEDSQPVEEVKEISNEAPSSETSG